MYGRCQRRHERQLARPPGRRSSFRADFNPAYDEHYDLNHDTNINSLDLRLVAVSFGPCPTIPIRLSDLQTTGTPVNAWGPFERDRSNGEQADGDGGSLTINGVTYAKGLGTHAASDLSFALPAGCATFAAQVGIDDEVAGSAGSVTFEVWGGTSTRLYQSPLKTGADPATSVSVGIAGVSTLRLVVVPGGDNAFDHADWGDARVTCISGDGVSPLISGVGAAPAATSASIAWATDEIADSRVEYGLTAAYGTATPLASLFVTSHAVEVPGLTPATLYHYRVLSRDPYGNLTTGSDATFTTTASLLERRRHSARAHTRTPSSSLTSTAI